MKQKVVFLDRDGVINKDSSAFIKDWSEFEFLPRSLEAIRHLTEKGFKIILITNQSVINRKYASINTLETIHARMRDVIKRHGGEVRDIFYCPHVPADQCACRKPKPGLILQAQQKYGLDIKKTMMVGDSAKDIECARNAGCGANILVQTGNGIAAEKILAKKSIIPTHIVKDLYEAAFLLTDPDKQITPE